MILLFVIIILLPNVESSERPEDEFQATELTKYMENFEQCDILSRKTCAFTYESSSIARKVLTNFLLIQKGCTVLLHPISFAQDNQNLTEVEDYFIILDTRESVLDMAAHLTNSTFWMRSTRVHFLLCAKVTSRKFLYPVLHNIWQQKIYNFAFVIVVDTLEVYIFNDFLSKKISLIDASDKYFCDNIFPDKIQNLQGATVRVAIFEKFPLFFWNNATKSYEGAEVQVMNLFASIINATLKISYKPSDSIAVDGLHNNKTDIVFVGILQVRYFIMPMCFFFEIVII